MPTPTKTEFEQGKKHLRNAIEQARQNPCAPEDTGYSRPNEFDLLEPFTCLSNIDALVIRQEAGMWRAEVWLNYVPEGVPPMFGTASTAMHHTEAEALQAGYARINHMYQSERLGLSITEPVKGSMFIRGNNLVFVAR